MYNKKTNIHNVSSNSNKPKYFTSFKEPIDSSYRKINNQAQQYRNKRDTRPNQKENPSPLNKTTINNLNINNMKRELQQLGKFIPSTNLIPPQLESKQLLHQDSITKNEISNISPIYNKKKIKSDTKGTNYNQKLNTLIKRLGQISESAYFSPEKPNKTVKEDPHQKSKYQTKSLNSKRIETSRFLQKSIFQYSHENYSHEYRRQDNKGHMEDSYINKQSKSIFLISDTHQESDRILINNYLYNTSRQELHKNSNNNIMQINPDREFKQTSSIQWYLLQEKLLKNLPLELNILKQWKHHRSRITNIALQDKHIYTSSLDYSVIKTYFQQDNNSQSIIKHRGGVQSLFVTDQLVISGGRDCYLRSSNNWSKKFSSIITQIHQLNKSTLLLKSDQLIEFDLQKQIQKRTCQLSRGSRLLQSIIDKQIFSTYKDTLFNYDSRIGKIKKIFNLPDNISVWKMSSKGKIMAIGKNLWIGNQLGMQQQFQLGDIGTEVNNITDYYSGYLISLINGKLILTDQSGKKGQIQSQFLNWRNINSYPINSTANNKIWMISKEGGLQICMIR